MWHFIQICLTSCISSTSVKGESKEKRINCIYVLSNLISLVDIDIDWLHDADKYIPWLRSTHNSEERKQVLMFEVHGKGTLSSLVLMQPKSGPFVS